MTKKVITVPAGAEPRVTTPRYGTTRVIAYPNHDSLWFEGSLDEAIKQLQDARKRYKNEYQNLRIDTVRDCGCFGDCSCSPTYYVAGDRLETDLEYEVRLEKEAKWKADQEERDRKEFERLQKKFNNG